MLELIQGLSVLELIIWSLLAVLFFYQFFYQLISYRKLLFFKHKEDIQQQAINSLPPVSVIICARNEAPNLRQFLPQLLEQKYPEFQVVVVNDCSEDNSEQVLEDYRTQYSHLYVTHIKSDPIYRHGKKLAVTLGIKAAKYEHLVFTDADCYPTSDTWLQSMAGHYNKDKKIILGVSPYEKSKGLLGQVIAYETLQTAVAYISSALRQRAYMGVGRNMAYTKSVFYDNNGFSGHTHLLSGDDDLFVNKAATENNVAVEFSAASIMKSMPETRWSEFLKQKRRHLTTGKLYKKKQKIRFGIETVQGFMFYCTFITLLALGSFPLIVGAVFLLRFLLSSTFRTIAAKKMNFEQAFFFQSLWLDILVPMIRTSIVIVNTIKPQKFTWR